MGDIHWSKNSEITQFTRPHVEGMKRVGRDGLLDDPERMRIGLRHCDGGEGGVRIVHAASLRHRAEKGDSIIHGGATSLGGQPDGDLFEPLETITAHVGASVAPCAKSDVGFSDRMIGQASLAVLDGMRGVGAAIIGTREHRPGGIHGDEVAEEFKFPATCFNFGHGGAELQHVTKDEIDRHELIEVESDAGADE